MSESRLPYLLDPREAPPALSRNGHKKASPVENLVRRVRQLSRANGRYHLELIVFEGQWLLSVDGGKLELLGQEGPGVNSSCEEGGNAVK